MKKCGYCGRENEQVVAACCECGTPLVDEEPGSLIALLRWTPKALSSSSIASSWPARWSARDALKCFAMMLIFRFLLEFIWRALQGMLHAFAQWSISGFGDFTYAVCFYALNILTALYFSRIESLPEFGEAFGVERSPSSLVWFAVVVTLILRWVGGMVLSLGWAHGVHSSYLWGFRHTFGPERYFYLIPVVLLAPLCEEIYMRGFLYRALRGSFAMLPSVGIIIAITAFSHWWEFRQSWWAVVGVTSITLLQCYLRERTGNLWDCIICHLVFNGTLLVGGLTPHS